MRVTIWKNDKESTERAITRFNKKVQASRKLLEVRAGKHHSKPKTKRLQRKVAIMREFYRSQRDKNKFY
jgi:ribosomal protein S21